MADTSLKRLLLQLGVFAVLLGTLDTAVRIYGQGHFVPFRKLAEAVAAGDGCVVTTGGSDMMSAIDAPVLERGLRQGGAPACVAPLALGATTEDVRFMAFRAYLEHHRKPASVVLGFKGYDIADEATYRPGYYLGNAAAVFVWGKAGDLASYYTGPSFDALDNSLRFLLYQVTGLGANRQALWIRLSLLEQRLGLRASDPMNSFGYVKEFVALEDAKRRTALGKQRGPSERYELKPWTAKLVEAATAAGAKVHFVRLPALTASERAYFRDAESERHFDAFVSGIAREHGGRFVDLSHEPWFDDALLVDGLHYSARGSELISEALARALRPSPP